MRFCRVALDLLLHDDDTLLLNIDPEHTLDRTPNDRLTSTVPSPITKKQNSHTSLQNIVVPYKNNRALRRSRFETTSLNMLASSNEVYVAVCLTNLFRKTDYSRQCCTPPPNAAAAGNLAHAAAPTIIFTPMSA